MVEFLTFIMSLFNISFIINENNITLNQFKVDLGGRFVDMGILW